MPPDFDALPSVPYLPDPLAFQGRTASSSSEWPAQRAAILAAFTHYVIGTYPEAPGNVEGTVLAERRGPSGAIVREVELSFGPGGRAKLGLELAVPPGQGPFPVFMTQRNHIGWARIALARGYAAVVYNGCDAADDTQAFKELWPDHDWTMLCRRAWGAGRVLDWLETLPAVDATSACITGHSRNGKLSLICSAIDQRFALVISSSSGVGGASPYRFTNEGQFGEGIELITFNFPEWLHPRLRFFAGREDKLPVDANLLIALSAPRAVLVSTALNDGVESVLANERALDSARRVWELVGEDALRKVCILWREGGHETRAEDIERYVDWCDIHLGRTDEQTKRRRWGSFPEIRYFPYTFGGWKWRSGESMSLQDSQVRAPLAASMPADLDAWRQARPDRVQRIGFLLGEEPPVAPRAASAYGAESAHVSAMLGRPARSDPQEPDRVPLNFGEYVSGAVYAPAGAVERAERTGEKLPVIVWLHPESVAFGYSGAYVVGPRHPRPLVGAGFAVLAYDQIGNGSRIHEGSQFHERYPRWSLAGKMVRDAIAAAEAARRLTWADPARVFVLGFGVGGTIAAIAAALDTDIAGAAIVSGFTPLRTDTPDRPTGGIARYCLWQGSGLFPRLGFFVRRSEDAGRIPIDFDEILGSIAPRPLLCVTPTLDREANSADVQAALEAVAQVYALHGASEKLWRSAPPTHRHFSKEIQEELYQALLRAAAT